MIRTILLFVDRTDKQCPRGKQVFSLEGIFLNISLNLSALAEMGFVTLRKEFCKSKQDAEIIAFKWTEVPVQRDFLLKFPEDNVSSC